MNDIPPLSPELKSEIDALHDDLDALLRRRPRRQVAGLDARRRTLLERHLGHPAPGDIETITCIGDSNTMFFAGSERLRFIHYRRTGLLKPHWINRGLDLLPCFRTFHVGPSTAWKAGDFGASTRAREKIERLLRKDIAPGSKILLSFGEIDCRIHMARAVKDGKPVADLVEATAAKFVRFPESLAARGYRPLVWGPPQVLPTDENLDEAFPFVGPWELRRDLTHAYIDRLRHHCDRAGIPCVAIAGTYHPPEIRTPPEFFHDGTHLSQRLMPLALRELADTGFTTPDLRPS